jgi:hypothetical protein
MPRGWCSVEDCPRRHYGRGYCRKHWLAFIEIPRRAERAQVFLSDPSDPRHGTTNGYGNLTCRCERCTKAWAEDHLERMHADPQRMARHAAAQHDRRLMAGHDS